MSNPSDENYPSGWWDEFDDITGFNPQDPENEWEASALDAEQLAQPRAIGLSTIAGLFTRMEQMARAGGFENDVGNARTQLTQQDYQHDHEQQYKLPEDEIKAPFDFSNPELGYDPLSADLTPEQEAMEAIRTRDAALDIFGPTVLEGDLNKEYYDFDLSPIDSLEMLPDFNITDRKVEELLESSFGETPEQRSMVTEGSKSNEHLQKRQKISTEVLQAQVTLHPSGSTSSKIPSFEDTENRKEVDRRKRKERAQRCKGKKTTKKGFEAVARSQNSASPLNAASPVPNSAPWSWANSSTPRPIAPRPSPRSSFENAFNTPRGVQAVPSQGHPSPLAPRGHQRQKSNQSNLLFAGPVQPSSVSAYGAGSPQGPRASAPTYSQFPIPTHPRFSQTPHSRARTEMAVETAPVQTPVTTTTPTTPTAPTTPTPRGLASLPRRPSGPLPNFDGHPIRQPNFGSQSPPPTTGRECATVTFPTQVERNEGFQLLKDAGSKEEERFKLWRESHPRFKETKVYFDLDPESTTIELCGPIGSNVRGALSSLFEGQYQVSARLG